MTALSPKHRLWLWLPIPAAIALLAWLLMRFAGLDAYSAWQDAATDIIFGGIALWNIRILLRIYPTRVGVMGYAAITGLVIGLLACLAHYQLLRIWPGSTDAAYTAWLRQSLPVRISLFGCLGPGAALLSASDKKIKSLEERFLLQAGAEKLHREAELFKLRQQLQPHFLYNSLNSISALLLIDPERAREMVGLLSDFLRSSVRREGHERVPLSEELAYIHAYLAIEAVRFGNRLQVSIDAPGPADASLPPFLLQPLLENAIKFGLYGRTGDVQISLGIRLEPAMLRICMTNPYDPLSRPPSGTGFGLESIRRRLYLLFGRTDLLETQSQDESFTTILNIPQ